MYDKITFKLLCSLFMFQVSILLEKFSNTFHGIHYNLSTINYHNEWKMFTIKSLQIYHFFYRHSLN